MVVRVSFQFRNKCKVLPCFWWSQTSPLVTWILLFQQQMRLPLNVNGEQRELLQMRQPQWVSCCTFLHAIFYLLIVKQALFLQGWETSVAKLCSIARESQAGDGAATRDCPALSIPHLQYFPPRSPRGRLEWASYLWKKCQSLCSRGI